VVCGGPRPCGPAKSRLVDDFADDALSLFLYLSIALLDAIDDSRGAKGPAPADLYDRFIGWARAFTAPGVWRGRPTAKARPVRRQRMVGGAGAGRRVTTSRRTS
jgi:hypothetical protein